MGWIGGAPTPRQAYMSPAVNGLVAKDLAWHAGGSLAAGSRFLCLSPFHIAVSSSDTRDEGKLGWPGRNVSFLS